WWKFMINVGINQPSAILRATYGVFQKNEHARALMFSAMQEVVELSERAGIGLSERDLEDWQKTLGSLHPDGKTSMLQDVEAGRRTEVDLFAGAMISMGEQYGVPVPVNTALYRMLKTIESLEKGA
ncbi:ketopantoate reductase family protein, partial [Salinispira pacifica]